MHLIGQIVIKRPDGGNFAGPRGGVEAVIGIRAVLVLDTVAAEISHITVDIRQRHRRYKIQIHIHDVDFIQSLAGQRGIADLFHVAEEITQIKEVFVDRTLGMCFDVFVVRQEIPQDLRRFSAVIIHIG